jgi:hypothetical protein
MQHRRVLAAALLIAAGAAHAEHFEYKVDLTGTYSAGGTEGCTPPFDQPACPVAGTLSGLLSFDTPASGDGSWSVEADFGDITDLYVSLGSLATDQLFGGIGVQNGAPNGFVQAGDQTETFSFDWADRTASYSYDYGYHSSNGQFTGSLSAVPEPGVALLFLAGMAGLFGAVRRRERTGRRD